MKIICLITLKGGVAKTISAINIAWTLNQINKRVLLIDNDKQGNTSKFFGYHNYDEKSIADVLINCKVEGVIQPITINTDMVNYDINFKSPHFDLIPANMDLLHTDRQTNTN